MISKIIDIPIPGIETARGVFYPAIHNEPEPLLRTGVPGKLADPESVMI